MTRPAAMATICYGNVVKCGLKETRTRLENFGFYGLAEDVEELNTGAARISDYKPEDGLRLCGIVYRTAAGSYTVCILENPSQDDILLKTEEMGIDKHVQGENRRRHSA